MMLLKNGVLPATLAILAGCATGAIEIKPVPFKPDQVERVCHRSLPDKAVRVRCEKGAVNLLLESGAWDAGVKIVPPAGKKFDFSDARFLAVDVENLSTTDQMRLTMHISSGSPGSGGGSHVDLRKREVNTGIALNPGEKRTMRLYLPHRARYSAPEGSCNLKATLDTTRINAVEFKLQWPFEPSGKKVLADCRISNLRLEGEPDRTPVSKIADYHPFVDRYGQYRHGDWPEKITSDRQLILNREREAAELAKLGRPASWDRFGGWQAGPKLTATGSFRTEKYQGKWFLVDPEGHLFWSAGIDVLRFTQDGIDSSKHPAWYEGKGRLDFNGENNRRKYGTENAFYDTLTKRLPAWGINTIGNWASNDLMKLGRTPYTVCLTEFSPWKRDQFAKFDPPAKVKFYDAFDPAFEENMGRLLVVRAGADEFIRRSIQDPMCVGYFIDNELEFGKVRAAVIKSLPTQPAKRAFVDGLRKRYASIDALNRAWKSSFDDFDAVLKIKSTPPGEGFRHDMDEFMERFFDRYFEVCRQGVKSAAPDRLYLGCRFVGFGNDHNPAAVWKSAAKFCDVISVNTYTPSIYHADPDQLHGKPVLIGEFHFGTYDRGMFSPSLAPTGTQEERAISYIRYMQGALRHPNIVGAHWFQFRDQPLTGRGDGEGYQIGFVDVADTPYEELCRAARDVGENMYTYRLGKSFNCSMR